ncbi:hypothetical protein D1BOALGB6SA_5548 [Olavius sp. associated proteobacterium Delta 1]|nr:hypothetical protein D1BOALGB6SA_5548 [Olavius sp. associated proteobacterium Delta 1]
MHQKCLDLNCAILGSNELPDPARRQNPPNDRSVLTVADY